MVFSYPQLWILRGPRTGHEISVVNEKSYLEKELMLCYLIVIIQWEMEIVLSLDVLTISK